MTKTTTSALRRVLPLAGAAAMAMLAAGSAQGAALPGYGADPNSATVSGISSGGFQAVQMHVAFSALFKGAAIFAGGPFYCAEGTVGNATGRCMTSTSESNVPVSSLVTTTKNWATAGSIDPVANLTNSKVYIWHGTSDSTVKQAVGNALKTYYGNFVNSANIVYKNNVAAQHAWVTWKSGSPIVACATGGAPYISNCGVDPEQTFLQQFYGTLNAKATTLSGSFLQFDQNEFFTDNAATSHSMEATGWAYVPSACTTSGSNCRVHLSLHGCKQGYGTVGDQFVKLNGLNEWADTNKVIVLYPQAKADTLKGNPNGWWDWGGYDDANYAKKSGRQMAALKKMVDRVISVSTGGGTNPPPVDPPPSGGTCFTATNYAHVAAGRAHDSMGTALANGSNQSMGLDNLFYSTTLKQTGTNYYVIGTCN